MAYWYAVAGDQDDKLPLRFVQPRTVVAVMANGEEHAQSLGRGGEGSQRIETQPRLAAMRSSTALDSGLSGIPIGRDELHVRTSLLPRCDHLAQAPNTYAEPERFPGVSGFSRY
jgi:hypothetical protein